MARRAAAPPPTPAGLPPRPSPPPAHRPRSAAVQRRPTAGLTGAVGPAGHPPPPRGRVLREPRGWQGAVPARWPCHGRGRDSGGAGSRPPPHPPRCQQQRWRRSGGACPPLRWRRGQVTARPAPPAAWRRREAGEPRRLRPGGRAGCGGRRAELSGRAGEGGGWDARCAAQPCRG